MVAGREADPVQRETRWAKRGLRRGRGHEESVDACGRRFPDDRVRVVARRYASRGSRVFRRSGERSDHFEDSHYHRETVIQREALIGVDSTLSFLNDFRPNLRWD